MASGQMIPRLFKNNSGKLALGIWPWTQGLKSRLPGHYKKRYVEAVMKEPVPVHYRPDPRKYRFTKYGQRMPVQNIPIPLTFPPEADLGLWGGEGFITGYRKKNDKKLKPPVPYIWKPRLFRKPLYSEILDRWMEITITARTLNLIDEAYGFDYYILKTHQVDLRSKLGMRLKREMLTALGKKSLYLDNPEKREEIYEKYKEFIIPEDEIEWLGLSLTQAVMKLAAAEHQREEDNTRPLKEVYVAELIAKLQENLIEETKMSEGSVLTKLNPFKDAK